MIYRALSRASLPSKRRDGCIANAKAEPEAGAQYELGPGRIQACPCAARPAPLIPQSERARTPVAGSDPATTRADRLSSRISSSSRGEHLFTLHPYIIHTHSGTTKTARLAIHPPFPRLPPLPPSPHPPTHPPSRVDTLVLGARPTLHHPRRARSSSAPFQTTSN